MSSVVRNDPARRVVVVTGASRGIGRACALRLAGPGTHVVVHYGRGADEASGVVELIRAAGGSAEASGHDLTGPADGVGAWLQGIIDAHGRLDTLVSNAGIALDGLVIRLKDDDWQRLLAINLTAPLTLSRVAARCMMRQRDGAVVHVSSVVGETGNAGQVGYATTKAGILGLVKSLARELGPRGVRVNAVAPGLIDTDMTAHLTPEAIQALLGRVPLGRAGTADEVAHAVSFLASPAAGYITGEVLRVNGGLHM